MTMAMSNNVDGSTNKTFITIPGKNYVINICFLKYDSRIDIFNLFLKNQMNVHSFYYYLDKKLRIYQNRT